MGLKARTSARSSVVTPVMKQLVKNDEERPIVMFLSISNLD